MLLLDLGAATRPHAYWITQAVNEAVSGKKTLPMGWKAVSRYLTGQELEKARSDTMQRLLNIFRSLPDDKEFEAAARAGQAKKGWYAASAQSLMEVFGPDTPRFVALLASTSPQVSVTENLRIAFRLWGAWLHAGRPMTTKGIDAIGKQVLGDRWQGEDGKPGMGWRNNVLTSLTAPAPEKVVLSSGGIVGKVDSFRANLLGDLSRVTNDAWMSHFAEIDQELFGTKAGYLAMTAKVRRVAEKMGWTPAEVQETVWSFFKALHESQAKKNLRGTEAAKALSHDDVNQSEDFADLMLRDEEVKHALKKLRDRKLVGEPIDRVRDGGQDPASSPYDAAASRGLAGSLERVARRAEALKHTQDSQELATRGYFFPNATDIKWDRRRVTFTLTDPREIAEWNEKPRKPEDVYGMVIGSTKGKWNVCSGVAHGVPTVQTLANGLRITLPFQERENKVQVEIDPEKWRKVEAKKQEKAAKIARGL